MVFMVPLVPWVRVGAATLGVEGVEGVTTAEVVGLGVRVGVGPATHLGHSCPVCLVTGVVMAAL